MFNLSLVRERLMACSYYNSWNIKALATIS